LRRGIDPGDEAALAELCEQVRIDFMRRDGQQRVILDGEDVSGEIRTPAVSLLTSRVSSVAAVRDKMVAMQREMGREGGVVLEGRDIGSVVFPDAGIKFFLTASAQERGARRYRELREQGHEVDLRQTIEEVVSRDEADSSRQHSPLTQAEDAILVDSTDMTIEQVVEMMARRVRSLGRDTGCMGGESA
jgi:cytidylate kinase